MIYFILSFKNIRSIVTLYVTKDILKNYKLKICNFITFEILCLLNCILLWILFFILWFNKILNFKEKANDDFQLNMQELMPVEVFNDNLNLL